MGKRTFKRLVPVADLHCGHMVGLTPPQFNTQLPERKYYRIRHDLYENFKQKIDELKPIDYAVVVGDAVDGKGKRSGGTEQITSDMNGQVDIASECIQYLEADQNFMVYGTAYHVSPGGQDWEMQIANRVGAKKITSQLWLDINGLIFDFRHKLSNTSVPYGKGTPISKEKLVNTLWAQRDVQPEADIIIRAHTHSFFHCGDDRWFGVSLPSLQGLGSKYGARECSNIVHFGVVWFDIYPDGSWKWGYKIQPIESQKDRAIRLS